VGGALGYLLRRSIALGRISSLEYKAKENLSSADLKAKEAVFTAKDKATSIIAEAQKEERELKQELRRLEERLLKREDTLEKQRVAIEFREAEHKKGLEQIQVIEEEVKALREKTEKELENWRMCPD